jgi:hypothetical protein
VLIPKAHAFRQLAAEKDWLGGKNPRSMLAPARHPPREWIDIAKQVEKVLADPELVDVLRELERHNRLEMEKHTRNRDTPFLLGPHLFHVIHAVLGRKATLSKMPVLERRSQEIRSHFQDLAAKAKALARLVRKGPQPLVALAPRDRETGATTLFQPRMIGSPDRQKAIVPLDQFLDDAAASLEGVKISSTRWHRKPAKEQLRHYAASFLATRFREQFNHPYHSHIATIVTVLTGIDTDEDYVKKIDKRRPGVAGVKGHNS